LFKDDVPMVRYQAVMATASNWDERFVAPLMALFRDPYQMIRQQASQRLCLHEPASRAPVYVALLQDPDPNVQASAFRVLSRINRQAIPREDLVRLLGSQQFEVIAQALNVLEGGQSTELGPLPPIMGPGSSSHEAQLSSAEAAPLTTSQYTLARLIGIKILRHNADAQAIELTLPLLRDTNSLVRTRASSLLQSVSGQDIPATDPAKWDAWWAANKSTFTPRKVP
jgi:HEAT repeat protein